MAQPKKIDPKTLDSADFRTIRQRLGWSMAEMGRRMGGDVALITAWETGTTRPESEALNQYVFLSNHVDQASTQVARVPLAETHMEDANLAQVTHRDLI